MLLLSRRKNETVLIDGHVVVEVLSVKGNTLRLGITAPKEVAILRGEVTPHGDKPGTAQPPVIRPK